MIVDFINPAGFNNPAANTQDHDNNYRKKGTTL